MSLTVADDDVGQRIQCPGMSRRRMQGPIADPASALWLQYSDASSAAGRAHLVPLRSRAASATVQRQARLAYPGIVASGNNAGAMPRRVHQYECQHELRRHQRERHRQLASARTAHARVSQVEPIGHRALTRADRASVQSDAGFDVPSTRSHAAGRVHAAPGWDEGDDHAYRPDRRIGRRTELEQLVFVSGETQKGPVSGHAHTI